MNRNIVAALVVRMLEAGADRLRAQPPKRRSLIYLIAALAALLVLILLVIGLWLAPGLLGALKAVWLFVGPVVVLVVTQLARTHLDLGDDSDAAPARVFGEGH